MRCVNVRFCFWLCSAGLRRIRILRIFRFVPPCFVSGCCAGTLKIAASGARALLAMTKMAGFAREPLNKSAAALSGSFAPTDRFENLEIHKVFLRFPNLNLEQNPSLTALAIESELPYSISCYSIPQFAPGCNQKTHPQVCPAGARSDLSCFRTRCRCGAGCGR